MKRLILAFAILAFFSCKKKAEPTPAPVDNTDYADSLVGTYKGNKIVAYGSSEQYNNSTDSVTVTKVSKNKINIVYFYSPYTTQIFLDCSSPDKAQGLISLTVTAGTYKANIPHQSSNYFMSTSSNPHGLQFYVQTTTTGTTSQYSYSFNGTKK